MCHPPGAPFFENKEVLIHSSEDPASEKVKMGIKDTPAYGCHRARQAARQHREGNEDTQIEITKY
jgi:hypothetical protein